MDRKTTRIYQDDRGIWHWIYALPMLKNFSILRTILKPMAVFVLLPPLLVLYTIISRGRTLREGSGSLLITFGFAAFILLITFLCYLLVAALYGWYYISIYTLSEESLTVSQPAGQAAKSMAIGAFTSAAGALGNNPGIMMAGLASGGNTIVQTKLSEIRSLLIDKPAGEIRIHSFLTWYSIYICPEDFDFVAEFLRVRCTNASVRERHPR